MGSTFRMTYPTAVVLQALSAGHRYGFEIADVVGLRPGSVYQVLRRLEDRGYLAGEWEDAARAREEGRPARRYYRLRGDEARELVARARRRYPGVEAVVTGRPAAGAGPVPGEGRP